MPEFAEVAVNQTLRRTRPSELAVPEVFAPSARGVFHYRIPPHLAGVVRVGQMVWVPFGPHRVQGVILGFSDTAPVENVRELDGIVEAEPALSSAHIALARWVSDFYVSPLADAVRLMLPPGMSQRLETIVRLKASPPWPDDLTAEQKALLDYLARRSPRRWALLRSRFPASDLRRDVKALERRALVAREKQLAPPKAQPRTERYVRLTATEAQIASALPRLGRSTAASRLLALLAQSDEPVWPLDRACEQAEASPAVAQRLAAEGWVALQPRRTLIMLDRAATDARPTHDTHAAVLDFLRAKGGVAEQDALMREVGVSAAVVRTLVDKGWLRRVDEAPRIHLTAPREKALERVAEIQGLTKYRAILSVLQQATEPLWLSWVYAETDCTLDDIRALEEQGLVQIGYKDVERSPLADRLFPPEPPPTLTPDQERVWQGVREAMRAEGSQVVLLHGVTGSGKTEIYLRALEETLRAGKQAIVLVPEISLTPQTVQRFAARFPGKVTVLHSGLSEGERFDQWQGVRAGKYPVVVGARSALFAPVRRLGLLILDEEHDPSYKNDHTPRYHARDVAVQLGQLTGATVILGSATPDVVTYTLAKQGRYRLLELPQRILWSRQRMEQARKGLPTPRPQEAGAATVLFSDLPRVEVVDLRRELLEGNRSIFSRALQAALRETLSAGHQAILFLNRRGAASFVICRDCGYVVRCPQCELPLTYHSAASALICHHCNHREPAPATCPSCGSARIRYLGVGTQRVEEVVKEMFPSARTLRWDRDTARQPRAYDEFLEHFIRGRADILIGTQMIAKGLDLPRVTLVGVISADTALYLPDFRAAERTFQLLAQVAGRAGRSVLGGRVIIQTYTPQQPCIQAASRHDYAAFYEHEMAFRREHGYPPFSRMARLIYVDSSIRRCREEGARMRAYLEDRVRRLGLPWVDIVGPAPCFLPRVRGEFRWHIVIRTDDPYPLLANLAYDARWRVDVDPVDFV
ncbi:MAG: hypothetical protein Kow00123_01670 [Anaerolineales bacterium]